MTLPGGDSAHTALLLLAAAGGLLALSGVPGLFLGRRSPWGPRIFVALTVVGSLLGLAGGCLALTGSGGAILGFPSPMQGLRAGLGADALSGFFSLPVFLVGGLGCGLRRVLLGAPAPSAQRPPPPLLLRPPAGEPRVHSPRARRHRLPDRLGGAWRSPPSSSSPPRTTTRRCARPAGSTWSYSHVGDPLPVRAVRSCARSSPASFALRRRSPAARRPATCARRSSCWRSSASASRRDHAAALWLPGAHATAPSHVSAVMSGVMHQDGHLRPGADRRRCCPTPPLWLGRRCCWRWARLAACSASPSRSASTT